MTKEGVAFQKKGFIPLTFNAYGGIGWRGDHLPDFWMWNRQTVGCTDGGVRAQTIKVSELKEAAIRYWRDNWVPVAGVTGELLRRMESALRSHPGLRAAGETFPDTEFLTEPEAIPAGLLGCGPAMSFGEQS